MRRFLGQVGLFLALQAALFAALDTFYMRHFGQNHHLAAWREKSERLAAVSAPRLLLVGGSSNAFGFDSSALERAFRRPAVNLALNAGFGLRFILNQAADVVRPGDLVILTPEYWLLERGEHFDSRAVFTAARVTPETLRFVPASIVPRLLDEGFVPISDRLRALWSHLRGAAADPIYTRSAFNPWGDMVGHHAYGSWRGGEKHAHVPTAAEAEEACEPLAWFAAEVRTRGAELLIVPPPIPLDDYKAQRATIGPLWHRLGECTRADVALVRRTFPRSQFFDTAYHLTEEGRRERTRFLAVWARRNVVAAPPGE